MSAAEIPSRGGIESMLGTQVIALPIRALNEPVVFMTPLELQAFEDYCRDCDADPTGEWLTFKEYFREWLDCRDEQESLELLEIEQARERSPKALASPCGDDEIPF